MTTAIDFIKKAEGLRLEAYLDGAGIPTIGFGHTGPDVKMGMKIDADQADDLLRNDMAWALDLVRTTVKVELTKGQHSACTSLIFNIGPGAWRKSTVLRRLNAGNYEGAAEAILMWNKITVGGKKVRSRGLAIRRERERKLFLSDIQKHSEEVAHTAAAVSGGEAKPAVESKTQWLGTSGVLASIMMAWGQIKDGAPEMVETLIPYLPYLLGAIFAMVMLNRYLDSRKGKH